MRTLWRGGRVYSAAVRDASAVLTDGGVVAWIGDEDSAEAAAAMRDADAVVDLDGALVTPAFVDAHVHLTGTGLALTGLDLTAVTSGADLLAVVAARAATLPAGATVLGSGWDESTWRDPGVPSTDEVERAAGGRPVYLARVDAHSALVSAGVLGRVDPGTAGWDATGWLTREAHPRRPRGHARRVAPGRPPAGPGRRAAATRRPGGSAACTSAAARPSPRPTTCATPWPSGASPRPR